MYIGKLGSGKSVLLANIVDDLNLHVRSKNIVVAYFFCRHDIPESLKARSLAYFPALIAFRDIKTSAIKTKRGIYSVA